MNYDEEMVQVVGLVQVINKSMFGDRCLQLESMCCNIAVVHMYAAKKLHSTISKVQ